MDTQFLHDMSTPVNQQELEANAAAKRLLHAAFHRAGSGQSLVAPSFICDFRNFDPDGNGHLSALELQCLVDKGAGDNRATANFLLHNYDSIRDLDGLRMGTSALGISKHDLEVMNLLQTKNGLDSLVSTRAWEGAFLGLEGGAMGGVGAAVFTSFLTGARNPWLLGAVVLGGVAVGACLGYAHFRQQGSDYYSKKQRLIQNLK